MQFHIAILCSRLDLPGGIERAIVNLTNLLEEKGHNVTLVILDDTKRSFFPIRNKVRIIQQPLFFGIMDKGNLISRKTKFIHDIIRLRRIFKALHADLVIASENPFAIGAVFAGAKNYSKLISWEHHHFYELKRNFFWERLFRIAYPRLDAVVCLNEDEKKFLEQINSNVFVIPNFINPPEAIELPTFNLQLSTILTIARLSHVKGIDLLLQTAKLVFQKYPDLRWKIIGDGNLKKEVVDFIQNENLRDKLVLLQPTDHNIWPEYEDASMYIMTSRNECFPMTLIEAMSYGIPCIAFDCETGPRHIIQHNYNGLLVEKENPEKLVMAISVLIDDKEKRKKMSENALESVKQFSPEIIYNLWQNEILRSER